jgi:hypothetical protein
MRDGEPKRQSPHGVARGIAVPVSYAVNAVKTAHITAAAVGSAVKYCPQTVNRVRYYMRSCSALHARQQCAHMRTTLLRTLRIAQQR